MTRRHTQTYVLTYSTEEVAVITWWFDKGGRKIFSEDFQTQHLLVDDDKDLAFIVCPFAGGSFLLLITLIS